MWSSGPVSVESTSGRYSTGSDLFRAAPLWASATLWAAIPYTKAMKGLPWSRYPGRAESTAIRISWVTSSTDRLALSAPPTRERQYRTTPGRTSSSTRAAAVRSPLTAAVTASSNSSAVPVIELGSPLVTRVWYGGAAFLSGMRLWSRRISRRVRRRTSGWRSFKLGALLLRLSGTHEWPSVTARHHRGPHHGQGTASGPVLHRAEDRARHS